MTMILVNRHTVADAPRRDLWINSRHIVTILEMSDPALAMLKLANGDILTVNETARTLGQRIRDAERSVS